MNQSHLWVVTSYFNPCGYETRLSNFQLFRESLGRAGVNWLAVECAFGDAPFELGESANVVRVRARHVMWQKERLLNVALESLPRRCAKVAWLDADVLFENMDWAIEASRALEEFPVVQLFERVVRLPRGHTSDTGEGQTYASFASVYRRRPDLSREGDFERHGHTGFAWAARRELLDGRGLYDACVAGSGDHVMAHALCGDFDGCVRRVLGADSRHLKHFGAWGAQLYERVGGRVGCVRGTLLHLWHGDKANRRYLSRNRKLASFGFDPARDLCVGPTGCWEWASDKRDMHQWFVEYFDGREEDGERRSANGNGRYLEERAEGRAAQHGPAACVMSSVDEDEDDS